MSEFQTIAPAPEALRALADREEELRSLLSNISGMVYRAYASPPWHLTYVSDGVELLTGYPPAHFLEEKHRWAAIMLAEDVSRVASELAMSASEGREVRVEYRIRRRDGAIRWVEARVRTFPGDQPFYMGTVFDIDERKRTEHALAESREHQRYIIESVPSTLWTAMPDGDIDFISGAGRTYVGATVSQRLGGGWLMFVHPSERERVQARWQQSLRTGDPYEANFRQSDL
ncbi:MAG: PAS domain-containing protein, partial [Panacagrimonas sp.]